MDNSSKKSCSGEINNFLYACDVDGSCKGSYLKRGENFAELFALAEEEDELDRMKRNIGLMEVISSKYIPSE